MAGNHDIPLTNFSPTDYSHETTFRNFVKEFHGRELPALRRFTHPDGRHIELLAINSVRLRTPSLMNYGYVDWSQHDVVLRRVPKPDAKTTRIAVLHHHVTTASRIEPVETSGAALPASVSVTIDAGEVLEGLQSSGFRLVMHGHQHVPRISYLSRGYLRDRSYQLAGLDELLYVVAGGSAGAKRERLSAEVPYNTYNILRLNAGEATVTARQFGPEQKATTHFEAKLRL